MKNNQIIYFPAIVGLPFLAIISNRSPETIALGFISISLLVLFLYTIRLMGRSEPSSLSIEPEPIEDRNPSNTTAAFDESTSGAKSPSKKTIPSSNNVTTYTNPSNRELPNPSGIQGYRRTRFKKETLGPMVKEFLANLPIRSKIDNSLFCIFENSNYHEFLIQRGKLFIDCDTDAYLEASKQDIDTILDQRHVIRDSNKKLMIPIYSPIRNYGALILESLSGFNPKDALVLQSECNRFAFEWETRSDYELAILDPQTMVYNLSHFKTILREKFQSQEKNALFYLEITGTRNKEDFISFLAEYLKFPIYRLEESRLAFFILEQELGSLPERINSSILELDKQGFYAEFLLAYSMRDEEMLSSQDWEEEARQQLYISKHKSKIA